MPTTATSIRRSAPTTAFARVRNFLGGPEILLGVVATFVVYQVATTSAPRSWRRSRGARLSRSPGSRSDSHGAAAST